MNWLNEIIILEYKIIDMNFEFKEEQEMIFR